MITHINLLLASTDPRHALNVPDEWRLAKEQGMAHPNIAPGSRLFLNAGEDDFGFTVAQSDGMAARLSR